MLEYDWGNPSTIMLSGGDEAATTQEEDQNRQTNIFDHYTTQSFNDNSLISQPTSTTLMFNNPATTNTSTTTTHQNNFSSFYDPRAYAAGGSSYSTTPHHPSFLSLDPIHSVPSAGNATSYFLIPKTEERSSDLFASRIGLNLGGRTYFSSAEDDFVNRLYRRSRSIEPGSSSNAPRCQAEGCNTDLTHAKHYHRRHKVCEFHSKASTVIAAGLTQRFCQQCSRFHLLSEFDNGKRSCRKRLADHNRRRRKSNQQAKEENQKSQLENAGNSSSENFTRSPPESGVHASPSVTVAISPPRMSLDCFKQRSYQATTSSSTSSSSLFFSSG